MQWKRDWFFIGMLVAAVLAWVYPSAGAQGGWLYPEILTKAGVALIFFLHGMSLSFDAMKQGAMNWRLHAFIQIAVFLLFPAIGIGLMFLTKGWLSDDLRLGLFFLCALPSTVSSSIALTAAAGGNVPSAVFNATLSSLLGIFLTPLWIKLVWQGSGASMPLGAIVLDLTLWLVLPLVVGQILRKWLAAWAKRNKSWIGVVDRLTILLLIYTSFCDSFVFGVWTKHGYIAVVASAVVSVVLFYFVLYILGFASDRLRFNREDRIAALFCGSKKSMATGVPMAQLMFGANPALGLILLPIMIYHPFQLIICGILANNWAKDDSPRH
ncbi:MAG: bile acid:sodium symporter family protein [Pirellula sp.]|jgi:sodium/bile acid cotransporter 7